MRVFRVYSIIDGEILQEGVWPKGCDFTVGNLIGGLTNVRDAGWAESPSWRILIRLGDGPESRAIKMPVDNFLTADEYERSRAAPLSFADMLAFQNPDEPGLASYGCLWLFRDSIYVTERDPRPSERETVLLQIKALHFQRDESFKRLREQVANLEAIDTLLKGGPVRRTIPDDVKLTVWTRDGGACVKCGASTQLHFDHVIPLVRGGSDEVENLQLLCRSCNLAKGGRIA